MLPSGGIRNRFSPKYYLSLEIIAHIASYDIIYGMLSQKYRFHSRGGVNFVHQKGQMIRTPMMAVTFIRNERGYRRFAVVVSKKVMKSAVGRNRIRRRVYEAIRLEFPDNQPPTDYIFTVYNPGVMKMPFRELRRLIQELLTRIEKAD